MSSRRQKSGRLSGRIPSSKGSHPPTIKPQSAPAPQGQRPRGHHPGSKVSFSVGRRKSVHPVVQQKEDARARWKQAIRKVLAFIRFQIPLNKFEDEQSVTLSPTYKLHPDEGKKFSSSRAKAAIERILRDRLGAYEYHRSSAVKLVKLLSALINDGMKELSFPRYKFVTNVVIVENKNQNICITSRCVWDTKVDEYATVEVKGQTFVAVASVHGVYMD